MSHTIKFDVAEISRIFDKTYLMLQVPDYKEEQKLRKFVSQMPDKSHVAEIKQYREKRSLDANARFWVLCGKLSDVLGIPPVEIYRDYVRNIGGNYDIVPVANDRVDVWIKNWESNGIGWIAESLGESKHEGYTNVINYAGSSTYNTKQMHNLLNLVIFDCKEQGIETLSPDELARLVDEWGEKHEPKN